MRSGLLSRPQNNTLGAVVQLLDTFSNAEFDRGASRAKEALWQLVRWFFFETSLPWPSSIKCSLLRAFGATVGKGVVIRPRVGISFPWRLRVGDHSWLGEGVRILSLAEVEIGAHVCVSQEAYLCTGSHDYKRPDFRLITQPIRLANHSWVGARAFLAPGVELGEAAVAAAGSVVTKSVSARQIVQGNPAQVVRERTTGDT